MGWKRATTEDKRAARRTRILNAASTLLESWSLDDVNVDRIAKAAGIAKGTVYLYFRTREELVLEVFDRHHGLWLEALETELRDGTAPLRPEEAARLTVSTLLDNPLLIRLYGQMGAIVAGNISLEAGRDLRLRQASRIAVIARALERRFSGVTSAQASRWLVRVEAFAAGIVPRTGAPGTVLGAFDVSDRADHHLDLESELQYIAVTMLLSP
jgi:AcrR family transcriptional regulator